MLPAAKTFGVLDRVDVADIHVVSIKGGDPLVDLPESASTVWAPGTFTIGNVRYQASTHSIYTCIKAHTTVGSTPPSQDGANWKYYATTERWRLFDLYRSTKTVASNRLQIVMRPLMVVDTIDLQGLRGYQASITITDGPGGPVILPTTTYDLGGDGITDWEPFFYDPVALSDSLYVSDLPVCSDPIVTIEITFPGNQVELGMLQLGSFIPLGWTEYDADIGVVSYSYIKEAEDGTLTLRKRSSAGDMNVRVWVDPADARRVAAMLDRYDGVATLWVGHTGSEFSPLRKVGFFDGRLSYPNFAQRTLSGRVKGVI